MPKDKDRAMNPALAQHRQDKQRALKKGKAEALARRNEKLARRNPDRIQRQIDELKSVEQAGTGQSLRPRDKQLLEALERDLRAVLKAREALGEKAPTFPSSRYRGGDGGDGEGTSTLRKRRRIGTTDGRDHQHHHRRRFNDARSDDSGSDTDESVRRIPMPRDTPPPIPREYLRRNNDRRRGRDEGDDAIPLSHPLPARPVAIAAEPRTVYEAAPEIRNLRQEAVSKFVPAAVRMKQNAIKGQGKLLEPEEMDRLEQSGYNVSMQKNLKPAADHPQPTATAVDSGVDSDQQRRLEEEERRFNQELRSVQIEDVEDEDG